MEVMCNIRVVSLLPSLTGSLTDIKPGAYLGSCVGDRLAFCKALLYFAGIRALLPGILFNLVLARLSQNELIWCIALCSFICCEVETK